MKNYDSQLTLDETGTIVIGCDENAVLVKIPKGVTTIWYEAFMGCSSLSTIEIPNSVTSIDDYAFYG